MTASLQITEHLFRHQSGKMHSILINQFGFEYAELIEDIIQETFLAALKNWGIKGSPKNPEAWLMHVAKNKFINEIKRRKRHGKLNYNFIQTSEIEKLAESANDEIAKWEQLKLLFSCCSSLISSKAQIMLTLKIISGFGDREIAKALLMNVQAVRKAIFRARNILKVKSQKGVEIYVVDYPERLDNVLMVLYLMFNEGYHTTSGDELLDEDISFEAIRLTSWLLDIDVLDHGKIHALLSLMFLNFARFDSRTNAKNEIIDIEHQDRSLWDSLCIQKGIQHQKKSRESTVLSRYHIECGIAAEHCISKCYEQTNWKNIVSLYDQLLKVDSSPIVKINRAIAIAEMGDHTKSLEILKKIERSEKENSSLLFGAMARVYLLKKEYKLAASYYKVAADLTNNLNELKFFEVKLSQILLFTDGLNT